MRSYLLLAAVASAFVAPQRALQRVTSLRAAPEVSEQQSWMIDYMAKAHTARLEAVKRAKAEAAAEMEARRVGLGHVVDHPALLFAHLRRGA